MKDTAYVQIPALRDTLAEKHVTKILQCFTISATPCNVCKVIVLTLFQLLEGENVHLCHRVTTAVFKMLGPIHASLNKQ